jgi:phenylpropionate dioxygenase-like ring-hydroxylating dioxygenase large terminal subunit
MAKAFIKNCWYAAAWSSEIANEIHATSIIGEPLLLYRLPDGGVTVMEDRCCHRFAPLSKGRLEDGGNLRCMYHGMLFNAQGGCIDIPCQDKIPETAKVRTFPAVERGGWVWVWMGDVGKADPALIPPVVGLDSSEYILKTGSLDYDVDYELINDNLTDLSHLAYVHANSFGAKEAWARIPPVVRRIPRGIRVTRWIGPGNSLEKLASGDQGLADFVPTDQASWTGYDYLAPGILLLYNASYNIADMPADGVSPPAEGAVPTSSNFSNHVITPLSEKRSRYTFSFGPHASFGNEQMAMGMVEVAKRAFEEDRVMLEAQQKSMDLGTPREVVISADVGPIQMRSVIRQLIKDEGRNESVQQFATTAEELV